MLTVYNIGIVAAIITLVCRVVQLVKYRKSGTPLPAEWGYGTVQTVGLLIFFLHNFLPQDTPERWRFGFALLGINLILVGAIGVLRRLLGGRKKPSAHELPERIANR